MTVGAISAAGSLASSVEDLAKFVSLQFRDGPAGGSQILRGSTLREMHRIQWANPDLRALWPFWGLGFSLRRAGDQFRVSHGGGLPGHATYVEFAPATRLGVIVLTNANDGDALRYVDQAFGLLGPALARATATGDAAGAVPPAWQTYAGAYEAPVCATCAYRYDQMQILILNGEMTMITPDAEHPWESRLILRPETLHTFIVTSPGFSFDVVGERLTFDVDAAGKVVRVHMPSRTWLPRR